MGLVIGFPLNPLEATDDSVATEALLVPQLHAGLLVPLRAAGLRVPEHLLAGHEPLASPVCSLALAPETCLTWSPDGALLPFLVGRVPLQK